MTRFLVAFTLLVMTPAFGAGTATSTGNPVIEAVYGKGAPALTIGEESYELAEGQELKAGYKVTTDGESAVRILYPDSTQVYVGRSSEVEISGTGAGTPVLKQNAGKTRALVAKGDTPATKGKVKFLMRTKSAVMGVRGTDFVTQTDAEGLNTQIHTLEGQVAVASPGDESNLFSGKGILLGPNQFIMARLGSALGQAQLFQRVQFLKSLGTDQPGFKSLMDRLPRGYDQLLKLKGLGGLGNGIQRKTIDDLQKLNKIPQMPNLRK